jgi:hypothetical protein
LNGVEDIVPRLVGDIVILFHVFAFDELDGVVSCGVRFELLRCQLLSACFALAIVVCPDVDNVIRSRAFDMGEQVALVLCARYEVA